MEGEQLRRIEKWRHVNVDGNWAQYMIRRFEADMERYGFFVARHDTLFSGFGSQGDGVSFTGWVTNMRDFIQFLTKDETRYPLIRQFSDDMQIDLRAYRVRGHYVHSRTMNVDAVDTMLNVQALNACDLIVEIYRVRQRAIDMEVDDLIDAARTALRAKADELYVELEREYDYLTSDEQVWETIKDHEGLNWFADVE